LPENEIEAGTSAEAVGKFAITNVAIKMGTKVRNLKGIKANPVELMT
jgi:rRNA maturation endonuclease Nob1